MKKEPLHGNEKFTSWTIKRVAEALSGEWRSLGPTLEHDAQTAYAYKSTRIFFRGEVNVTLDITRDKYPSKDAIEIVILVSLSPDPNDLSTHVLNTLNLGMFLGCFPDLMDKKLFSMRKDEPWEGSALQAAAGRSQPLIETMLKFENCFHLLLDDEYDVDDTKLDSKSLSLTHHLNQVKAYRLAEIYGHPDKLDEAIRAIKRFAQIDALSQQRLDKLCAAKSAGGMDWLYTPEMIERLCE